MNNTGKPAAGQHSAHGEVWDTMDVHGNELDDATRDAIEGEISQQVFMAALAEKNCGTLGDGTAMKRLVNTVTAPDAPDWEDVLMDKFRDLMVCDTSLSRPDRRHVARGVYLPGELREPNGIAALVVDTSGSITQHMLDIMGAHMNLIFETVGIKEVWVIYCDNAVRKTEHYMDGEPIELRMYGGKGTDFTPPFLWLDKEEIEPDLMVYFTDGIGSVKEHRLPYDEPDYPVIWGSTRQSPIYPDHWDCDEVEIVL